MNETILLVEDEDGLVTYLRSELGFEGYQVVVAQDGQTAWETYQAQAEQIDLILLDWMLPRLDGLEVMRRIRKLSQVPIIMMTARDYVGDKVAGLDNGADDYITKPFEIEELLARIRVNLRHHDAPAKKQLSCGDTLLDTKAHQVTRNGETTQLTQREFDLLQTLMQHAGQPMTRDELLDQVWGPEFDGQVNIVDVYIRYLRNKIEHPSLPPLIQTVRGVGYEIGGKA
ncbi:response regulator transcription factor [Lacticaseibacillus mingshuiensis]|uniref:Response regulator transcription factor n=1 Tax=Lacticaseibacillus mingshuiensis TaxID=2799574 RepID=A0ABW4CI02_9LACO|nr:response regulator transcription factor [Lacticaseibacillus mingshuiensis]